MSVSRHHADWLSLLEISGPFLSMPVLMRVFPQGLDQRDAEKARELRSAYEAWCENPKAPGRHRAWLDFVLRRLLEFPPATIAEGQSLPQGLEAAMPEFGETLRPDLAILPPPDPRPAAPGPRLLVQLYPPGQDLDAAIAGRFWKASAATRMMELLHACNVPLGLLTNGEQWMLVYAPRGETTGYATWHAQLWQEEPITLRAFHSLLHCRRFFGVAEPDTPAALLKESAQDQQEVTDQLGYQVRKAVEVLVQAFDRLDQDSGRKLLAGVSEKHLYEAALTMMMRLVFLFCAEERKLLPPSPSTQYDDAYSVSTLGERLRENADQHGEEILERRHDAWARLLATFRAVHGGLEHEAVRIPPYGGSLFDPDRFPFLEGRAADTKWHDSPAQPLAVNNRVVLHLLEALQFLRVKLPGGGPAEARRLSFRALDIEQIGHVYEGLLDHTAVRTPGAVLGLRGTRDHEPEIPLEKLEELRAAGADKLLEFLKEETGRSEKALRKALESVASENSQHSTLNHQLLIACAQDHRLLQRLKPFAGLIREDDFGQPIVILAGSVYVTAGTTRRSTGTHYTPRSLTEPIVQHTLEPLVYVGPAEGKPKAEWKLKSPKDLLALKICDMTMGSGAFLVQTCRYLSERLVESWEIEETKHNTSPPPGAAANQLHPPSFIPHPLQLLGAEPSQGNPSERLLPKDPTERMAVARRAIADRCLYGVDINPMAVEMAKLSLWLITLQRDRPFTFLDHALKCGDSLLGVSDVKQIENFSLRPGERQVTFATANLFRYVEEAGRKRRELEDLPSNDHTQIETKQRLHAEAEAATAKVKALADCLIAFELRGLDGEKYDEARAVAADHAEVAMKKSLPEFQAHARHQLARRNGPGSSFIPHTSHLPFHWPVEFPEVFARGGFDAFVGNPPFIGGQKITGTLGTDYRTYLVERLANAQRGSADLCAYFFLRANSLLRPDGGTFGLVATNTIAQGDTREVGLEQLLATSPPATLIRAIPSTPWPGIAALEIAHVWLRRGLWGGESMLDGRAVRGITASLAEPAAVSGKPHRLAANAGKSFQGSIVLGMGFVLTPEEAHALIAKDPRNRDVLFPYLNGEDLNTRPDQSPSRWVINFQDWPLEKAEDYPDCFAIVREKVKPEREKNNREVYRRYWWQHGEKRPALYSILRQFSRALTVSLVTHHLGFEFVPSSIVFAHRLAVFPLTRFTDFSVMQSNFHEPWAREYSSSLETRINYSPSDCCETFPFPVHFEGLETIGSDYYRCRHEIMLTRQEGLTKTYNRFHDRGEQSVDIARLRALHVEMDQAVAAAYGWSDLDLGHGFHQTKQGIRYTLSEPARRTVLDRLLALNHQRYEEEVKAGLHDKKKRGAGSREQGIKRRKGATPAQGDLLPPPQRDLFA